MLANALQFVTKELNNFLDRNTTERKTWVKLSGLVPPEGGISLEEENTLVLSLVNISEENERANEQFDHRQNNDLVKQPPPLYLNVHILIAALFNVNQYAQGLQKLSLAITFFQQKPLFTSEVFEMPKGIDKLSFELTNLDIDGVSRFWSALGAPYRPSVIYKMRILANSNETMEAIIPELVETDVNTGPR